MRVDSSALSDGDWDGLLDAASFSPVSLEAPNAWCGHIPFASWVIRQVQPKTFVELGTHTGNSYFSFCQAVREAHLDTKCYAVDTWEGDEHAGRYGEEVYRQVFEHNEARYAEFSRLLRMRFDDALSYFSDGSVGLLHIDGLHTYEAVKHDFESWLPKLSPGAVVLFHDSNVRERGFGVWRLWEELRVRHPLHLEFLHSNGLAVLQLGDPDVENCLKWLKRDGKVEQKLRAYFSALGARHLERLNAIHQSEQFERKLAALEQTVREYELQAEALRQTELQAEALREAVAHAEQRTADQERQIQELNALAVEREQQITRLLQSPSWRWTHPLRVLRNAFKKS